MIIAELQISFVNTFSNFQLKKKKSFKIDTKKRKPLNNVENLSLALNKLTMFVGTIFPGKNSIIREISINFNKKFNFDEKKIDIFSKKLDSRFPIINNKMNYKNYNIEFQTLVRPKFKFKKVVISKKVKNIINKIEEKILIIGAGSGIGKELLNVFKLNNKLKIVATYHKNKFLTKDKNIQVIKLDIEKSIGRIKQLINKFKRIKVYYFATPKINLSAKDKASLSLYRRFYIQYPLEILSSFKGQNIEFFYPSTIYIDQIKSSYTEMKKSAEERLNKINKKNIRLNILRIDEINTKQNISMINKNLPSFNQLLNKNKHYQNKIFFINQ